MTVSTTAHVNFRGQARAPFAPLYGMVTDRFGVTWIVGVDAAQH